jgi:hypothetical protein
LVRFLLGVRWRVAQWPSPRPIIDDSWWPREEPSDRPRVPIDQVVQHLGWRVKLELLNRDLIYFDDQRRLSPVSRLAITERKAEIVDWLAAWADSSGTYVAD